MNESNNSPNNLHIPTEKNEEKIVNMNEKN